MPNNVKTYDRSNDPEDHLKIFQAAAKVERWAMPTWCHMFNSTLNGSARVWFYDLPSESIDSYDDLKKAFLANYLKQKKCIKDPVEIYHIKQREGESTKDFVQRFKAESRHVKGSPECMRIFGFMYGITNLELIKCLYENIPKSVDEMMRITATFLRGEVEASNQAWKKALLAWKQHEVGRKQNFNRRGDFRNQQRSERRCDKITLLTKSPKEILALDKGKFKASPPMTTPEEKRNSNKFCEFYGEVGHNSDECMHLKRLIEELIKNRKFSHVIKELKQGKNRRCGAFHLYMDEFCGSKITVSKQWDHRKARSEEDSSSPVKAHGMLNFPILGGILTLRSSRIILLECAMVSGPEAQPSDIIQAAKERIKVTIHPEYLEQIILIGSTLAEEG
ncbi:reverse transcriptase domain-containing protein [Tanacetum coccineum]